MTRSSAPAYRRARGSFLVGAVVLVSVFSVLIVAQKPESIVAGDPAAYRERVEAISEGGLPYLDVDFEHLPVMLAPMFAAWYLGGAESQAAYILVFALLMSGVLAASVVVADRIGAAIDEPRLSRRWVELLLPLLPVVLFRNDPVAVLLAIAATLALVKGRRSWWLWVSAGAMAKVWPAVVAAPGWARSRWEAALAGVSGVLAIGVTLLPGFREARQASGIHAETLVGAIVGGIRASGGDATRVTITTAAYIDVSGWMVGLNMVVGLGVVVMGVWSVFSVGDWRSRVVGTGIITAGAILVSQLFSLQYVLWLMPFVAMSRRLTTRALAIGLGVLTTALAFVWTQDKFDEAWFFGLFTLRNGLVIAIALLLAVEVRSTIDS